MRYMNVFLAVSLLAVAAGASAEEKGCIELATTAKTAQAYVNPDGRKAMRLVPVAKIVPGDEVIWTITARNACNVPVERIVIANAVPEHMSFVSSYGDGEGFAITYSLDGKAFLPAAALTVTAADGSIRRAQPETYRHVRWTYGDALAVGAETSVHYRAAVN